MKDWLRLAPVLVWLAWTAFAGSGDAWAEHGFEVTPFYGYRLDTEIDDIGFPNVDSLEIEHGSAFGIIVGYDVHDNGQVELQYGHQSTELKGNGELFLPSNQKLTDLDVDWWLVGGHYTGGERRDPFRGFIGFSLGLTHLDPSEPGFDGDSRFAFSFYGGLKAALAERIGLRFQLQYVTALIEGDNEAFCDPAGFCFVVDDSQYLEQFEFSMGLGFKL